MQKLKLGFGLCAVFAAAFILLSLGVMPTPVAAQAQTGSNWQAFYWDNNNFSGLPKVSRIDPAINFNWATGSPDPAIPPDNFSARWSLKLDFPAGTFRFRAGADDGIRVAINGNLIINRFTAAVNGFEISTADVQLGAGNYEIIVDYYEGVGQAGVLFDWTPLSAIGQTVPGQPTLTPAPTFTPTRVPIIKAVVIVNQANVRAGPGANFATIGLVFRDEQFQAIGRNGDFGFETWYLVKLKDGSEGWLFRQVIYVYGGDPATLPKTKKVVDARPVAPVTESGQTGVAPFEVQGVAIANALVRSSPSSRFGEKVGVIEKGSTFKILRLSRNRAWAFVDFKGLQGWVFVPNIRVVVGSLGVLPRGD